ncbi:hypothetical protein E0Z10_g8484 [Xylaria hypoxylon]|uniref:Methyltransferase type 12 domain-containing protein n=1 Tax=Xylaria hypoxylon TaxID=37992 RepID=A0A4Z0YB74_9PEZI|nr:hypothetical protein E0Z10_g8484 [Xylaria hypoxylon]
MTDKYADNMTRHASDAQRLDEQVDLMIENIGYILHPSIISALPKAPVIADVATGTGRFLLHARDLYPDGSFDGSDISRAAFPPPGDLPENVTLTVLDVKKPVPETLHEKYDVVNVRMLVAAMLPEDWAPAVVNLSRMLKPGGFLQWTECDVVSIKQLRGRGDSSVENIRFLQETFNTAIQEQISYGWSTLPTHMQEAGLHPIVRDIVSSDRIADTRERVTTNSIRVALAWARLMAARGTPGAMTAEEVDQLETNVQKDIESGAYLRYDIHIICGRKPSKQMTHSKL